MKTTDNTYNELIYKLQSATPHLKNSAALTSAIMQAVEQTEQLPKASRKPIIVRFRPILSVAASALIILFVYQQFEPCSYVDTNTKTQQKHKSELVVKQHEAIINTNNMNSFELVALYSKIRQERIYERQERIHNTLCFLSNMAK